MTVVTERLLGCNAESLDSYLRGLGFVVLASEVEPSVRSWWDEDAVLRIASARGLDDLAAQVVDTLRHKPPPLRTPWRGKAGREHEFVALRNQADELELDWFDACALPRLAEDPAARKTESPDRERSDRENNPLLGQGGSFGRSDPEAAYEDALERIRRVGSQLGGSVLAGALVATLRGEPLERKLAQRLSTAKSVLSAYQSGRATGAGSSVRDVEPTRQPANSSVWDIVLVLTGLRLFRGALTRRHDPGAPVQGSFPFVVRSRPVGTGPAGVHELRLDDDQAFEFLAPLWSSPCAPRTLRQLLPSARLRLRHGAARDTLDAILVQASNAAHGLGFDRLVRFALVAGADRRYRFAVRRGEVHALGARAARIAMDQVLPFLRNVERSIKQEPPSLAVARRRLEDALVELDRRDARPASPVAADAVRVQELLIALAAVQTPAAQAVGDGVETPRLSSEWFHLADDHSPAFRLARSLLAGLSDEGAAIPRATLLPHRHEHGRFVLDPTRTPPDMERVADPVRTLVELVLASVRRTHPSNLPRGGSARFADIATLLSGALGRDGERRLAVLCAALAGIHPAAPPAPASQDPLAHGIGADVARLLLAAQPSRTLPDTTGPAAPGEPDRNALERATALASLLLAGRVDIARVMADRELRRRGIPLLPPPPLGAACPRPTLLALAVLLPLDATACSALERAVSVTPTAPLHQGGSR
jgi:CRISPR-associated protein Csx17